MDYLKDICSFICPPGPGLPDKAGDTGTEAGEADDESVTPCPRLCPGPGLSVSHSHIGAGVNIAETRRQSEKS